MSLRRKERIDLLVEVATRQNKKFIDFLVYVARELWPDLRHETHVSYARSALQRLKNG